MWMSTPLMILSWCDDPLYLISDLTTLPAGVNYPRWRFASAPATYSQLGTTISMSHCEASHAQVMLTLTSPLGQRDTNGNVDFIECGILRCHQIDTTLAATHCLLCRRSAARKQTEKPVNSRTLTRHRRRDHRGVSKQMRKGTTEGIGGVSEAFQGSLAYVGINMPNSTVPVRLGCVSR